jgi:hypothetical protein
MNDRQRPGQFDGLRALARIVGRIVAGFAVLGGVALFMLCISLLNMVNQHLEENIAQKIRVEQIIKERGLAPDSMEVRELRIILEGPAKLERDRRFVRGMMAFGAVVAIAGAGWLFASLRSRPGRER